MHKIINGVYYPKQYTDFWKNMHILYVMTRMLITGSGCSVLVYKFMVSHDEGKQYFGSKGVVSSNL